MQEIAEAIDLASEAIELHPETYEGFYARAKGHLEHENIRDAFNDVQCALERSQSATIDIKKVLLRLQGDIECRLQASLGADPSTDL